MFELLDLSPQTFLLVPPSLPLETYRNSGFFDNVRGDGPFSYAPGFCGRAFLYVAFSVRLSTFFVSEDALLFPLLQDPVSTPARLVPAKGANLGFLRQTSFFYAALVPYVSLVFFQPFCDAPLLPWGFPLAASGHLSVGIVFCYVCTSLYTVLVRTHPFPFDPPSMFRFLRQYYRLPPEIPTQRLPQQSGLGFYFCSKFSFYLPRIQSVATSPQTPKMVRYFISQYVE